MKNDKEILNRRSARHQAHNYAIPGAYFVTICTAERNKYFGEIHQGNMILSGIGNIVKQCWSELPRKFGSIRFDSSVIMPNHFHGIIDIIPSESQNYRRGLIHQAHENKTEMAFRGDKHDLMNHDLEKGLMNQTPAKENIGISIKKTSRESANQVQWPMMKNPTITLGKKIRSFKAKSTKLIHDEGYCEFKWQRNYFDRIVRNELELLRIRNYIINNPLSWELDRENKESLNFDMESDKYYRCVYE